MTNKSLLLSSAGLKNIFEKEKDEFIFIFGEQEIPMSRIFAEFISPVVSHLHHSDPTANQIHYRYPSKASFPRYEEIFTKENIQLIKDLSRGTPIEIRKEQIKGMRMISILLCNQELYNKINELSSSEKVQEKTDLYIEELLMLESLSAVNKNHFFPMQDVVDVISRNFSEIESKKLICLSKRSLLSVISNEHLKLENEDELVDFIHEIFRGQEEEDVNVAFCEDEPDLVSFYEELEMSGLSDEKFKEILMKIEASKMTARLWSKICNRFCNPENSKENRYSGPKGRDFLFDGQKEHFLDGIISQLTKECGGSVHEKGIVEVTASSEESDSCRKAKNAVLFNDTKNWFCSKSIKNSWLRYDFKNKKVRPTHYAIKSKPYGPGDRHPQHWVIEGSNSGEDWKVLDTQKDVKSLNDNSVTCAFEIQEKLGKNEFYRFLRIRQTGLNACNSNWLGFSCLEFFGSMI